MSDQFARPGTISKAILDYFYEAEEATAKQAQKDLAESLTKDQVRTNITSQIQRGKLVVEGDVIRLSRPVRAAYEAANAGEAPVASHPVRNVFGPELSAKHYLPKQSMRPGADDFRAWPSRMN